MRLIFLLVLALGMTLPGIANLPPLDRDESRYVQATKQMAESGNHVDIRFQEESRYKKPVGIYWLQSVAVLAGGKGVEAPVWHYRLVSIAAILLAVSAVFLTGKSLFGTTGGLVAALALMTMFGVALEGRIAKTDAMLLAFAVIAQGTLARIYSSIRMRQALWPGHAWIFWAAQGIAILLKGPIVPLVSLLTVSALWLFERNGAWLKQLKPGRGALLSILIAAPWLVAITWESGGAFWSESVGTDMLGKVAAGQESHGAPPGYYLLSYGLYVWPLGPLLLAAALALLGRMRGSPPLLFLFAWYVPFWLLCELIPTKLPHYMLPAYPALALAFGWAMANLNAVHAPRQPNWQEWLFRIAVAGHAIVTVALAAVAIGAPIYLGNGVSPAGIIAAMAFIGTGWLGLRHAATSAGMVATAAAAAIAYGLLFAAVIPSLDKMWMTPRIVAALDVVRPCPDTVLAATGFHEPSLVFMAGTKTKLTDIEGAAKHLHADPACAIALVAVEEADRLAALLLPGGLGVSLLAKIEGVNYSNGKWLTLGLYSTGANETGNSEGGS